MRILLVEDNEAIAKGLVFSLKQNGFDVTHAPTCKEAVDFCGRSSADIAVLDVNLPDGNGFALYEDVVKPAGIPTIFLTVHDSEEDIVRCLNSGAEDYVIKPFSTGVLIARINKVLGNKKKLFTAGDVVLDADKPEVTRAGVPIQLTGLETKLFIYLCSNSGRVVTRSAIIDKIWDWTGNDVNDNTVTVYMKRLREKLGDGVIVTVKGLGYRVDGK